MQLFRKALESVNDTEKTIVMKGPLSDIYTQALGIVYARDDRGSEATTDNQSTEVTPDVGLESESNNKKKPPKIDVKKGAFHKWLNKKPGDPITETDIQKGLASSDPEVRKMATFAKNAKKWRDEKASKKAGKKVSTESFDIISFNNELALETQQMDVAILNKLASSINSAPPTDNFQTVYGVSKNQIDEEDVVNVTAELAKTAQDKSDEKNTEFILVIDAVNSGENGGNNFNNSVSEKLIPLADALECMVLCNGGKVYHSFEEFIKNN